MAEDLAGDVTRILSDLSRGDPSAEKALIERVYHELRRCAGALMRNERSGHTLQPTALVHEAFVRLRPHLGNMEDRRRLFAALHRAMRRVLIDHARARRAKKRNAEVAAQPPPQVQVAFDPSQLDLAEALEELGGIQPRLREVVEYRYLLDLTVEEVADQLNLSKSQIEKDWRFARAWLFHRLGTEP
jgi:RNA polymerase sigma-70 factor (ECF subfamily)